jgi:hypothetical protein
VRTLLSIAPFVLLLTNLCAAVRAAAQSTGNNTTATSLGATAANPRTAAYLAATRFAFDSDAASLEDVLTAIHRQCKLDLLADDTPRVDRQAVHLHGSLEAALNKVCDLYDYTFAASAARLPAVLLRKRFRDPVDIPQLHEKAVRQMAEDVCACLSSPLYQPGEEGEPIGLLWILFHTLNEDQMARLMAGGHLQFGALHPSQALLVKQTIYSVAFQSMTQAWIALRNRMRELDRSYLTVEFDNDGRCRFVLVQPNASPKQRPLVLRWLPEDAAFQRQSVTSKAMAPADSSPPPAATAADAAASDRADHLIDIDVENADLRSISEKLMAASGLKITAADHLEAHKQTLKIRAMSARRILELVAELNEWRLIGGETKATRVTGPAWHVADGIGTVPVELRKAIPLDFQHFLGLDIDYSNWLTTDEPEAWATLPSVRHVRYQLIRKQMSASDMQDKAASRLWQVVPVEAADGGRYRYADWSPGIKAAVIESLIRIMVEDAFSGGRAFDILQGFAVPSELNPEIVDVMLDGKVNGQYSMFGFGVTRTIGDRRDFMATMWELGKAQRPLPPNLQRAMDKYR